MNQFDKLFNDSVDCDLKFIKKEFPDFQKIFQRVDDFLKPILAEIAELKKNGKVSDDNTSGNLSSSRPSTKENIWPLGGETVIRSTRTRGQRNAFKESTHQNTDKSWNNVQVKAEKLSILAATKTSFANAAQQVSVKTEAEEMPAPTRLPPRKKRQRPDEPVSRITRSKIKQEKKSIRGGSDVIIQEVPVPTVVLDDDSEAKEDSRGSRKPTRQRTKKTAEKRSRSSSKESDTKRSKSDDSPAEETSSDAVSTPPLPPAVSSTTTNPNATFVASSPMNKELDKNSKTTRALNSTVVVEKPVLVMNPDDLMTDDESDEDQKKNTKKAPAVVQQVKSKKQVFSPFESSPVKKRVEAFEKLGAESGTLPPKLTRTKTRAMKKEEEVATSEVGGPPTEHFQTQTRNAVREKAKLFTPTAPSKIAVLKTQSATKYTAKNTSIAESSMSSRSVSAMKASQAESREREKRRREKEEEAQKKREAQIQAQMELKKKRNEEKQLKAQQQREAMEKEKQKALEAQRLRDEQKHKQLLAEQEEKKQKAREEYERKRLQAKIKAIEEKKREQMRMMEEKKKAEMLASKDEEMVRLAHKQRQKVQQEKEKDQQKPLYMTKTIPYLPLDDCYDSDEESFSNDKKYPSWSSEKNLLEAQKLVINAGERLKNTFFLRQAETADLQEIFEVIDPRKLKRNSSAVWQKPPRYTLLPTIYQDEGTDSD